MKDIRLTYYVLQAKTVSYTCGRSVCGDRVQRCTNCCNVFSAGKARSSRGAVVYKRTEREFSNFLDFTHVYQLSNQIASIAPG